MEILGNINTSESPILAPTATSALQNGGGTPEITSGTISAIPSAGTIGQLFIGTDTLTLYRDNGITWDTISGSNLSINGTTNQIGVSTVGTTSTLSIASNPILPGNESMTVPIGTTAQRPSVATDGLFRYNTTVNMPEFSSSFYGTARSFAGLARMVTDQNRGFWKDDFIGGAPTTGNFSNQSSIIGELGWSALQASGSTSWARVTEQNHPGILRMNTVSSATVVNQMTMLILGQPSTVTTSIHTSDVEYFQWIVRLPTTAANRIIRLGCGQQVNSTTFGTHGIFFQYDPNLSLQWRFVTRNASISTELTSTFGNVLANTWYKLEAWVDGTTWRWAINGIVQPSTSTTNIPALLVNVGIASSSTIASTVRNLDVDFFSMLTKEITRF